MINTFVKSVCVVCSALLLHGCALHRRETRIADDRVLLSSPMKSENSYYYYSIARIERDNGNLDAAIANIKKAINIDPASSYLKQELAILYLGQKETDKALKVLEELLEKEPTDVEALILYGGIKQKLQQYDDAINAFEKAIAIDPELEEIYLSLGRLYLDGNDEKNAFRIYRQLIQYFPNSFAGYFFLGKIYADQGNYTEAEAQFQKTIDLKPDLIEPRFELADVYKKQSPETKDDKEEINKKITEIYQEILNVYPQNVRASLELGYHYYSIGKKSEAEKIFKVLGEKSQTDQSILVEIIRLYVDTQQYNAAIAVLEGILKTDPESSDLHFIAGLVYSDGKNNQKKAIDHFIKVMPDSKFFENAAIRVAYIYQQEEKNDKAIAYLEGILKRAPENLEIILYLGSLYEESEKYEQAEQTFLKGLTIDPANTKFLYRLGVVYDKWGKKEASLEKMREVIQLDPKDANALNYLGYSLTELNRDLDEAERLIQEALKYKPDDGYITDSLGWVYYKKNQFKDAVKTLEKAITLIPDDPTILEHLGDAYLKLSNKKKALECYERSLKGKNEDKAGLELKIKQLKESGLQSK